ncbi:MAG: BadF/BadG/BcrA/BcrD ATPase family protein [Planctomycetaceae bacterium]
MTRGLWHWWHNIRIWCWESMPAEQKRRPGWRRFPIPVTHRTWSAAAQRVPETRAAVGFEAAESNIAAAIAAAFADARVTRGPVAAACIGAAGAGRSTEQQRLHSWAESSGVAEAVSITSDVELILAAASPDRVGIALVSGTGSLAFGRNSSGRTARAGGWGHFFGDEGSGYAIAIAGLRAAAQAADKRGPSTDLLPRLQDRLQTTTPMQLVERIHSDSMRLADIAALAEVVFAASESDEVARRIVVEAADALSTMVRTLVRELDFTAEPFSLALAGGVLVRQDRFRRYVTSRCGATDDHVTIVSDPVTGAVAIARSLIVSDAPGM